MPNELFDYFLIYCTQLFLCQFVVLDVPGVQRAFWFKQDDLAFVCSARAMLETCSARVVL